jgi:hypothetical protein
MQRFSLIANHPLYTGDIVIINRPAQAFVGASYSFAFAAVGGSGSLSWECRSTLPSGWTFSGSTLTYSGTLSSTAAFSVDIYVRDANFDHEILQTFAIEVIALPLTLSGDLQDQTNGVTITPYSYVASGGYPGYTYAITSGALPTGLSLNGATGQVTGTPTTNGAYSWAVTVTDSHSNPATIPDSCNVAAPALTLTGTATSPVTIDDAYSWTPATTGGVGPYTYSVGSGTLPAGTTLNTSTGEVHGTVTTVASFTFVIHVVDSASSSANSPSETVVVNANATALSIYNKIATSAGGHGAYWNLDEATTAISSSRADNANGAFPLGIAAAAMAIVNGPRGAGDNATGVGSGGYLTASRTVGDDLDVPASAQKYCLFGFIKFNSAPGSLLSIGGTYQGGSPPNGGYMLISGPTNAAYGYSGDTVTTTWAHANTTIPDTTNWHFYTMWRDNTDGKLRISVDGATAAVSATTCVPPQSNIAFLILGGLGSPDASVSRWGYIKGDYLTSSEQTWMVNSGSGRNWLEIKRLAGH